MKPVAISHLLKNLGKPCEPSVQLRAKNKYLRINIAKVESYGMSFPIKPTTARKLIKKAQPAEFGWKDKTLLDKSVRDAWKISPEQVEFDSSYFDHTLSPALEEIRARMGLIGNLKADLHDVLIYETGQFFRTHRDSEKAEGMVATLVAILPSAHQGGELVVEHNGKKIVYRSDTVKDEEILYFAFYADCPHEVLPVTSGYRIALTYNLILQSPDSQNKYDPQSALSLAIQQHFTLSSNHNKAPVLAYILEHQYTPKGLSWNTLKGEDIARVAALKTCARSLGLNVHLALAEVHESWECAFTGYRQRNPRNIKPEYMLCDYITLNYWINDAGNVEDLPAYELYDHHIVCLQNNEIFEPYQTDFEGYTGNAGNTLERWYHRAAIILSLEGSEDINLMTSKPLELVDKLLSLKPEDARRITQLVLPYWKGLPHSYANESNIKFVQLAYQLNSPELGHKLLLPLGNGISDTRNIPLLAKLQKLYSTTWVISLIRACLEKQAIKGNLDEQIRLWMKASPKQYMFITNCLITLELEKLVTKQAPNQFQDKSDNRINPVTTLLDAASLSQETALQDEILAQVKKHAANYSLLDLAAIAKHAFTHLKFVQFVRLQLQSVLEQEVVVNWSIKKVLECRCADCQGINTFLLSSTEKESVLPLPKSRRDHIERKIRALALPVDIETEKSGLPHKLLIRKSSILREQALQQRRLIQQASFELS